MCPKERMLSGFEQHPIFNSKVGYYRAIDLPGQVAPWGYLLKKKLSRPDFIHIPQFPTDSTRLRAYRYWIAYYKGLCLLDSMDDLHTEISELSLDEYLQ